MKHDYKSTPCPYIGITGLMTNAEAEACVALYREAWAAAGKDPTHDLMLGVLTSAKTLNGQTNKQPRRYPKREDIHAIFPRQLPETIACTGGAPDPDSFLRLNLVHVAPGPDNVAGFLIRAMQEGGTRCLGLQINAPWPALDELQRFRDRYPFSRVVLQVGTRALEAAGTSLAEPDAYKKVGARLRPYAGRDVITDVLLDPSAGTGTGITPDLLSLDANLKVQGALWPIYCDVFMSVDVQRGVAGGLSGETMDTVAPLLAGGIADRTEQPGFVCSIDAEGRLRDGADGGGNLDLDKVRAYLKAAVTMLTTPRFGPGGYYEAEQRRIAPDEASA